MQSNRTPSDTPAPAGQRIGFFLYGALCHAMFLGVFMYLAVFLADAFVPKTIDSGAAGPLGAALLVNLGLLALFAVPHSVMARPTFKRHWTKIVPVPIERSTYVLFSNLLMILLLWQWRPMPGVIWEVEAPLVRTVLWSVNGLGWLLIVFASFLINHFDLFGTRQVWLHLRGKEYTRPTFGVPILYRMVRHPLYVGWLLAFWVTPTMSAGHLLFSGVSSLYILIAIYFEERNLVEDHDEYAEYRQRVPMLIPFTKGVARQERDVQGSATRA